MGALVWVMTGLAIWHFTIFLPDRFWGGIVGAFIGCIIGAVVVGVILSGFDVPGNDDLSLLTCLEAIPGTIIGLGVVYAIGAHKENAEAGTRGGLARA
jgi:uncharacterized membrane protein YeaQ/YmgE (transglycosylase-associated protein family)